MKRNKRALFLLICEYLLLFILIFLASLFITYVFMPMGCDDVWLYGFSYNISKGLVIYRDFACVTTPFYYFIGSLFVKIFGNYVISVGVFNAVLVACIFLFMFRIIKWKALVIIPLIFIFFPNGYNLFCLFFLMLILMLIYLKKDGDFIIGIVIGLLFITKQNVGICLFISFIYYSKNKIKGLISFLIPFVFVIIYVLLNGAFYEFMDCCFLGLLDFGSGNKYFDVFGMFEILLLVVLLVKLIKSKFDNKELFYILMFQIICYPLMDAYHCFVCYVPILYYFIKLGYLNKCLLLITALFIYLFTILLFVFSCDSFNNHDNVLYLKNSGDLDILMNDFHEYLGDVNTYYFTGYFGYLYKLYYDIPIGKYDLWNDGNLGYHGVEKRIKEVYDICKESDCLFIVDGDLKENDKSQVSKFYNYIINNYDFIEEFDTFLIYSN